MLGFLFCKHKNAAESLWGIINNEMNDTVSKETIRNVISDLLYYAIDCPYTYEKTLENHDEAELTYLKELNEKKDQAIEESLRGMSSTMTK